MQFPVFMYVHMHAYICSMNMYACVAVRFLFLHFVGGGVCVTKSRKLSNC